MKYLYIIAINAYAFFIRIASVFNQKAKQFIKGRRNWSKGLAEKLETGASYIWFHCPSLGEFEQGRPLIEGIKKRYPYYKIILTFFSPSGYEVRKNYDHADIIMYLPFDSKRNARKFLNMVMPEKVFFIKYDFWYFYICELKKHLIPLYLISGIFREKQIFFRKSFLGHWFRGMLFQFEHFFVQDEKSGELLERAGIKKYTVSGDTRFDRVSAIAASSQEIPIVEKFRNNLPLIVAGSTWKPDEELLTRFINNHTNVKMIVAPHEVSPANISRLEYKLKKPFIKFSEAEKTDIIKYSVLIIDSIGMLSSLYKYGSVAYIGGGFGVGIHNILEPAIFGLPVIFGPNFKKFKEATDLKKIGGAFPIHDYSELENHLDEFFLNPDKLTKTSLICKNYVDNNVGATDIIIKKIFYN